MELGYSAYAQLKKWYGASNNHELDWLIHEYFAHHFSQKNPQMWLQIGEIYHDSIKDSLDCRQSYLIDPEDSSRTDYICSEVDQLPFEDDRFDMVVLSHVMQFNQDLTSVFRDVFRIINGEGLCVVIGFNRYSLTRLLDFHHAYHRHPPWNGELSSTMRLRRVLSQVGFELETVDYIHFGNMGSKSLRSHLQKMLENVGQILMPFMGSVYIIVAKKIEKGPIPIQVSWRRPKQDWKAWAEPTGQAMQQGEKE